MSDGPAVPVDPVRAFPDGEIDSRTSSCGGWLGWFGEGGTHAVAALAWKAAQGDDIPRELHDLRDALVAFHWRPAELETFLQKFWDDRADQPYKSIWNCLYDVIEMELNHHRPKGPAHKALSDMVARMRDLEQIVKNPPERNPVPPPPLRET